MKNIIVSFLAVFAVLFICSMFMQISGDDIPVNNDKKTIKAFLIGSYDSYDEAKKNINDGIIINEDGKYNIYYSILSEQSNIEYMMNYLNKKNIKYDIKNIDVSLEFEQELITYENLMKEASSNVALIKLNKKILKAYEELG